ncbi:MAG: YwiC-like family protein [Acidimicrobiia bacterium]
MTVAVERPTWKAVALPSEHGGWGLTLEPVLLGLLVAPSWAGLALGLAAFAAFLVRTPLKLAAVDIRRHRWLDRSRLALEIAAVEAVLLAGFALVAFVRAGARPFVPFLIAVPLFAVELLYDVRSRSRRLIPELCGAAGITVVAAAIVIAAGRSRRLAAALALVLVARAIGSIPFVRVQIQRLRHGAAATTGADAAQAASLAVAAAAVFVDHRALLGVIGTVGLTMVQALGMRRPPVKAKTLGLRQMAFGFSLVVLTVLGVWMGT